MREPWANRQMPTARSISRPPPAVAMANGLPCCPGGGQHGSCIGGLIGARGGGGKADTAYLGLGTGLVLGTCKAGIAEHCLPWPPKHRNIHNNTT